MNSFSALLRCLVSGSSFHHFRPSFIANIVVQYNSNEIIIDNDRPFGLG